MGYKRGICKHAPGLCNLYGKVRRVAIHADNFLTNHGEQFGQTLQAASQLAARVAPTAGMVLAGAGQFAQEYSKVRNEIAP